MSVIGWRNLPEHVSVHIRPEQSHLLIDSLNEMGFIPPTLQIPKLHVIFSKIIRTTFHTLDAELHVRVFSNGKLEAEYEPPRLRKWLDHIFRRSYSAHEFLIEKLDELGIDYVVDEHSRTLYNEVFPKEFPFVFSELYHFLTGGVILPAFIRPILKIFKFKSKAPAPLFPFDFSINVSPE